MKALMMTMLIAVSTVASAAITPFSLQWMNGSGMYSSANTPNGVFVIEAYFLNCPYCNQNAGNVNALAAEFSSNTRVQVLDVGIDRMDSQYATWIAKHKPNHPVLKDANRTLIRQLGTSGYPTTYVVDGATGNVVYETSGVWEADTKEEIRDSINELLTK